MRLLFIKEHCNGALFMLIALFGTLSLLCSIYFKFSCLLFTYIYTCFYVFLNCRAYFSLLIHQICKRKIVGEKRPLLQKDDNAFLSLYLFFIYLLQFNGNGNTKNLKNIYTNIILKKVEETGHKERQQSLY